jgi:hypothetical protein
VLDVLPTGISAASWGIGIGLAELAALVALAFWRAPKPVTRSRPRHAPVGAIVWGVLVAAVLAGALVWSIDSFGSTHVAPLAVAAVPSDGSVVVTISSGRDSGPYVLRLVTGTGQTVLADEIRVGPDNPTTITVAVPENTRETVEVTREGSETSLRELIIDSTADTAKVTG